MPERDKIRQFVREALLQQAQGKDASGKEPAGEAASHEIGIDESVKDVITEFDLRNVPPASRVIIREDAIVTPSARDVIRERNLDVQLRSRRSPVSRHKLIAIGADHGGFEMKEKVKRLLEGLGHKTRDFGTNSSDPVDYPDIAHAVARSVADGSSDLGIIIDGAGIGSAMTANKVPGVRAALCYDEATARNSREHNYANVLTLGGRMLSEEQIAKVVTVWLSTPEGEARHGKRVAKITAIEKQYSR
jgi:ribose 5-phosphate isomerase B